MPRWPRMSHEDTCPCPRRPRKSEGQFRDKKLSIDFDTFTPSDVSGQVHLRSFLFLYLFLLVSLFLNRFFCKWLVLVNETSGRKSVKAKKWPEKLPRKTFLIFLFGWVKWQWLWRKNPQSGWINIILSQIWRPEQTRASEKWHIFGWCSDIFFATPLGENEWQ